MPRKLITLALCALLFLSSCSLVSDDTPGAAATSGSAMGDPADKCVDARAGMVPGLVWLDEDVEADQIEWLTSVFEDSIFVERFRYVERAADDADVSRLLGDETAQDPPINDSRALFVVTMEPAVTGETVVAVFDEFDIIAGVSEAIVDPTSC